MQWQKIKWQELYRFITILFILLLSCSTKPEYCKGGYTEINKKCYNQGDLDVLQGFIDNSNWINVNPLELHIQKWNENGRLTYLWLEDDTLSGQIPENIGNLTQLDTLNLAFNQLSGEIPEGIGNLINLNWLYLYLNKLSGHIPDSICNIYPNLSNIYISYNKFCPPYPICIPIEKIGAQDTTNCQ